MVEKRSEWLKMLWVSSVFNRAVKHIQSVLIGYDENGHLQDWHLYIETAAASRGQIWTQRQWNHSWQTPSHWTQSTLSPTGCWHALVPLASFALQIAFSSSSIALEPFVAAFARTMRACWRWGLKEREEMTGGRGVNLLFFALSTFLFSFNPFRGWINLILNQNNIKTSVA